LKKYQGIFWENDAVAWIHSQLPPQGGGLYELPLKVRAFELAHS